MPYIGNTIRAADDYRLIDDISSGFNGSATSFALQVAGSTPVPFPKSPQQILVSVNGVIQEPDPTGASGFNLVGTNIVFSSAPTNGHAFFGIIYATADYLNAGGEFPAGSVGAPSFTFTGDQDTGIYRKGSGSIGFVSNATEIANTDSNGITISSGNLILGDSSGSSSDRIKLGASGDLEIYHDGTHSRIDDTGTGDLRLRSDKLQLQNPTGEEYFVGNSNGSVELYFDDSKKFETTSTGVQVTGNVNIPQANNLTTGSVITTSSTALTAVDSGMAVFGTSNDFRIYHNGSHSFLDNSNGVGNLILYANGTNSVVIQPVVGENSIVANSNSSVELFFNNSKKFETTANGADFTVASGGQVNIFGSGSDNGLRISGPQSASSACLFFNTNHQNVSGGTDQYTVQCGGANHTLMFKHGDTTGNVVFELDDTEHVRIPQDNKALKIGASQDLQLTHTGVFSNIYNATGDLDISSDVIRLKNGNRTENYAAFINNGQAEFYYDNSKKLNTVSDGVHMTRELRVVGTAVNDFESGRVRLTEDANEFLGGYVHYDGAANKLFIGVHPTSNSTVGEDVISISMNRSYNSENVELNFSGSKKFETTSTGATVTGRLLTDGVSMGDSEELLIGTGNDFKFRHDGTDNHIVSANGDINIQVADSENAIIAKPNGAVELYYDNSKKLETFASGLQVTGRIEIPDGSGYGLRIGDSDDLKIYHDGSNSYIDEGSGTGALIFKSNLFSFRNAADDEQLAKFNQDGAVELYHNDSKKVETTSTGVKLPDNSALELGDRNSGGVQGDLRLYHDGSNSYIDEIGSGNLFIRHGTDTAIFLQTNGKVELYHDNSKKFETTSTGATVTGRINSSSFGSQGAYSGQFGRIRVGADTHGNTIRCITDTNLNLAANNSVAFYIGGATDGSSFGTHIGLFDSGGLRPAANNTFDLGTSSHRWRDLYTNDLNLSNEGSSNDVDGTWGSYTIQEGAEDLFLINKRSGKKYKFNLTEVS
jgi:hypothetical protein